MTSNRTTIAATAAKKLPMERKIRNIGQLELAKEFGIFPATLVDVENERIQITDESFAELIAAMNTIFKSRIRKLGLNVNEDSNISKDNQI